MAFQRLWFGRPHSASTQTILFSSDMPDLQRLCRDGTSRLLLDEGLRCGEVPSHARHTVHLQQLWGRLGWTHHCQGESLSNHGQAFLEEC